MSDITVGENPQLRGHWLDRLPAIDADIAASSQNNSILPVRVKAHIRPPFRPRWRARNATLSLAAIVPPPRFAPASHSISSCPSRRAQRRYRLVSTTAM